MKLLKYLLSAILIVATIWSCTDEDFGSLDFLSTANAPTNVAAQFNATQDNTGTVTITPNAEAAVSYEVYFEESTTEPVKVKQGSSVTHVYAEGNYIVKLVAIGITGLKTEITLPLVVSFLAPQNLEVTWSKDEATSNKVNVIAKADLGISYDVYFGEVGNDVPVTANMGETASYIYAEPGTYTIKVVAKSAGPDTTEEILDVEATKIAAPIAKAPTPPTRAESDVISIFSDMYTNIAVNQWNPLDWGQSTVLSDFDVDGDNILKYDFLNWTGIVTDYDNPTDLSAMEYVHFDYWTNEATELNLELVNTSYPDGDPLKISKVTTPISTFGEWVSVDIPLTDFTTDMSGITQIVLSSTGKTVFIDNIYFYKAPSVTIAGALPINFEYPFTLSSFDGGAISVVDNPDTNGNSSANVAKLIKDAGQVWAGSKITVDTPFELSESMTVTAKVWSPRVGLKLLMKFEDAIPWPGNSETGASTATTTVANAWEELTFTITGVDASLEYYNLVLIMDDGTMGDGSSDFTIYVDDIAKQ